MILDVNMLKVILRIIWFVYIFVVVYVNIYVIKIFEIIFVKSLSYVLWKYVENVIEINVEISIIFFIEILIMLVCLEKVLLIVGSVSGIVIVMVDVYKYGFVKILSIFILFLIFYWL